MHQQKIQLVQERNPPNFQLCSEFIRSFYMLQVHMKILSPNWDCLMRAIFTLADFLTNKILDTGVKKIQI